MRNKPIPTLSLFSGAGGLDLGFIQAGFAIKACVEIEDNYCATLQANKNESLNVSGVPTIHCEDIRGFDVKPYRKLGIRCVIGGPPCQTFSAAGRRSGGVIGIEDERGQLFQAYIRVLQELQPEVFVFENVYGLPGANGGKPWQAIVSAFHKLGYQLRAEVVDSADYGVPQHRERLIMVGYRKGDFVFPLPTHGPDSANGQPLRSVEEAISDLQDPNEPAHDNLGGMYGDLLSLVPEGLNYAFFTAEMGHPEPVFAWRSKFHDLLYKVNRSEPCRTIKAQPGKFTGPFHWKNRHFTIQELKRLQTFPDNYEIVGSFAKVLEQIGNSVPPRLGFVIAQSVRDQLLEPRKALTFEVRPPGFVSTFRQRQRLKSVRFAEIARAAIDEQYGKRRSATKQRRAAVVYFLNPHSLFDRRRIKLEGRLKDSGPKFTVHIADEGAHVELKVARIGKVRSAQSIVEISGLRKYLPGYDTLRLTATIAEVPDIFHCWSVIEDALTRRSQFFTLIDIYGHYANRGDTVGIKGKWRLPAGGRLAMAINYFTDTARCGDFVGENELRSELGLTKSSLAAVVEEMREVRFDIRTSRTHPIIGDGRVLCTYPFPLLSPRALVESRVQLTEAVDGGKLARFG